MFSLHAFNEHAETIAQHNNIAAAADQIAHTVDDVLYVPADYNKLLWVAARGFDCLKGYLVSPSLRRLGVLDISPTENMSYYDYLIDGHARWTGDCPLSLDPGEGLEAFIFVGSEVTRFQSVAVCLGDALVAPIKGEIWTVRATVASVTSEESKWINGSITFDETLPVGRYQIVGAEVWRSWGTFFRFVPVGAKNRPGGLVCYYHQQKAPLWQRNGNMGVWCEFHSSTPPSIDFIDQQAEASEATVHMDLIKIG